MSKAITLSDIKTNIKIDLDDVVNVFLSQYETQLVERRKHLQKELKKVNDDYIKVVKDLAIPEQHNHHLAGFELPRWDITSHVESVSLHKGNEQIALTVSISEKGRSLARFHKTIDIDPEIRDILTDLSQKVDELRKDLSAVIADITDISRKERQVRGEISKRKLQESGMEELINDPGLRALVQLPDND